MSEFDRGPQRWSRLPIAAFHLHCYFLLHLMHHVAESHRVIADIRAFSVRNIQRSGKLASEYGLGSLEKND